MRLAVTEWPAERRGAPGVALVHGLASSSRIFHALARDLAPRFHVVAYDQRGHGRSDKPGSGYGFDQTTADLGRVLAATGLARPVVVGHSFGANVVLEFAVEAPERVAGIVLVDGGFGSMAERMDWATARVALAPPRLSGRPLDRLLEGARTRTPLGEFWSQDVEATMRSLFEVGPDGRARPRLARANHMRILRAMWAQPTTDLLASVAVPTLVVAARPSRPTPEEAGFYELKKQAARRIRRVGPNVRFEWMTGVHDLPLQRPSELAGRIAAFAKDAAGDR